MRLAAIYRETALTVSQTNKVKRLTALYRYYRAVIFLLKVQ